MAASYWVDSNRSILYVEYAGPMEVSETFEVIQRMFSDPEVRPGLRVISDHTTQTTLASAPRVLEAMPRFVELMSRVGAFRCAVVTTSVARVGMVNLMGAYARRRGIDLRAFRSRKDAEEWVLGAEDET